ncbi:hypothetical protein ACSQ67_014665 [Phaseolus vulgaris]
MGGGAAGDATMCDNVVAGLGSNEGGNEGVVALDAENLSDKGITRCGDNVVFFVVAVSPPRVKALGSNSFP